MLIGSRCKISHFIPRGMGKDYNIWLAVMPMISLVAMRFMGMIRNCYGNWLRWEQPLCLTFIKIKPFIWQIQGLICPNDTLLVALDCKPTNLLLQWGNGLLNNPHQPGRKCWFTIAPKDSSVPAFFIKKYGFGLAKSNRLTNGTWWWAIPICQRITENVASAMLPNTAVSL